MDAPPAARGPRRPSAEWRALRQSAGLGVRELGRIAGIPPTYISMIEAGRLVPTPDEARRLLEAVALRTR